MTTTFWLSFADDSGFLGACLIDVTDAMTADIAPDVAARFPRHLPGSEPIAAAAREAWRLGCNPGGQLLAIPIPDHLLHHCAHVPRGVLLSKADINRLQF